MIDALIERVESAYVLIDFQLRRISFHDEHSTLLRNSYSNCVIEHAQIEPLFTDEVRLSISGETWREGRKVKTTFTCKIAGQQYTEHESVVVYF